MSQTKAHETLTAKHSSLFNTWQKWSDIWDRVTLEWQVKPFHKKKKKTQTLAITCNNVLHYIRRG